MRATSPNSHDLVLPCREETPHFFAAQPCCSFCCRRAPNFAPRARAPHPISSPERTFCTIFQAGRLSRRHSPQSQQQRPSWQSVDLARLTRVTAAGTVAGALPAAAVSIAAVPLERRPSEGPVMVRSSSSSPLSREAAAAAAAAAAASRHADTGGGGGRGAADAGGLGGHAHESHRDHRRGSRSSQSQWSSYPGARRPLNGSGGHHAHAPWAEGSRTRDRGSFLDGGVSSGQSNGTHQDGDAGGRGANPDEWRQQPPEDEASYPQHPSPTSVPTRSKRRRDGSDCVGGVAGIAELLAPRPSADVSAGYQRGTPPSLAEAPSPLLPGSVGPGAGGERRRDSSTSPSPSPQRPLLHDRVRYGKGTLSPPLQPRGPPPVGVHAPASSHGAASAHDPRWQSHKASPCSAAEAALAKTSLSPLPSWDLGSGWRSRDRSRSGGGGGGGEARANAPRGGYSSLGSAESRWRDIEGDRGGLAVAYTGDQEFCDDDRLLRGSPPPPLDDPYLPSHSSSQPRDRRQQDQDRRAQPLYSMLPPAAVDAPPTNPPVFIRGVSDPGSYAAAAAQPLGSGAATDSLLRPPAPFTSAGLAEVNASVGDLVVPRESHSSLTFGELHRGGSGGGYGGGGEGVLGASAGAVEWGRREQRR